MEELEEDSATKPEDPLIRALDELGEGSGFLWMIFFFTMFPTIFAGMHSNTYIFIAQVPGHWCAVPELRRANWTAEQIRNVSSAGSCAKYDFDYSYLARVGFEKAVVYAQEHRPQARVLGCDDRYDYAKDTELESMVAEWDLVCGRETQRATVHMGLSLGKLLGAGILGVCADRYGRRTIYALGILVFVIAGPASALVPWYWVFVGLRLVTGACFSAIQFSALTTLTEAADSNHRQFMGVSFNAGFASSSIFVAGIAGVCATWRQVQLATSLPGLLLLLFVWYMPESPRWLISQGRRAEARAILEKFHGAAVAEDPPGLFVADDEKRPAEAAELSDQIRGLRVIFGHCELRKRACITFFTWMTASFTYYALALNVDNFSVNYYFYLVLLGLTEIPAYFVPSFILSSVMGRRQASSMFFSASALLLLTILTMSRSNAAMIAATALVGRFLLSVAYGIIIMWTSEFFPTISRNSALGTSSAMAHVGSISAPFAVDGLGKLAWWWPSTLCGSLALLAGFLCLALPETRNRSLADTVTEELAEGRGRVSFARSCKLCPS